jgi:hypothetical protein
MNRGTLPLSWRLSLASRRQAQQVVTEGLLEQALSISLSDVVVSSTLQVGRH